MKADPFAQLRLLDLQGRDSALDRLAHRRRTLPEIAEITRRAGLVAARRDDVVLAETRMSDLQRTLAKSEADIELVRNRKTRDEERLASGAVTQSKQLEDLQREVATLSARQSVLEDAELEVMEEAEQAQAELDALLAERDEHLRASEEAVVARDQTWVEIDEQVAAERVERELLAKDVPADLLALYEKIRATEGGVGAGPIERGRCGACRLELMQNEKAEYRAAPTDEVLRHECRRIVVRTAESGL